MPNSSPKKQHKEWKTLRVPIATHRLFRMRAAKEGIPIHILADRLVKTT